jgi:predicted amidohydrolase YtcJ
LARRSPDLHQLPVGAGIEDVLGQVEQHVATTSESGWVRLFGYSPADLREHRHPTRRELDRVCPDRPLLVIALGMHSGALNSAGLDAMGWLPPTSIPPGGRIPLERSRLPRGEVTESALYLAEAASRRSLIAHGGDAWIVESQAHAQDLAAAGITRVGDAAVSPEFDLLYQRAVTADMLPITVHRMPIGTQSLLASRTAGPPTGTGPPRSPVGAAKLFLDGGESCAICLSVGEALRVFGRIVTQTARGGEGLAAVRAALHGETVRPGRDFKLHRGTLFWDDHRLAATIADAADHGLQTAAHAMGNEAIDQATRVLRALGPRLDPLPGRPRLEHTVFCGPDLATRIADVGAIAVVSPIWLDELGPAFRNAAKLAGPSPIPLNTLTNAGVTLAGASDYPSAHYRVLPAIQAAVTRRVISDGTLHGPEEAITAEQAVRAYTTGSAAALGVDDIAGSITVGKQADLVILSHNPLDVDPSLIGSIQVLRTYVAGAAVHGVGTLG